VAARQSESAHFPSPTVDCPTAMTVNDDVL
jgi:hypothetical protein